MKPSSKSPNTSPIVKPVSFESEYVVFVFELFWRRACPLFLLGRWLLERAGLAAWPSVKACSSLAGWAGLSNKALIDKDNLWFSASVLKTLTSISWPSSNLSAGDATCSWAICETWTKPSTPGNTSTNAPKSVKRFTVPFKTVPSLAFSSILSQGPGRVSLIDNEIEDYNDRKN